MALDQENMQILNLVQAMLGSITPSIRQVSVALSSVGVRLYFVLEGDSSSDREEIEDIVFEFEALQSSQVGVDVEVLVDMRPLHKLGLPGRLVYSRTEPDL